MQEGRDFSQEVWQDATQQNKVLWLSATHAALLETVIERQSHPEVGYQPTKATATTVKGMARRAGYKEICSSGSRSTAGSKIRFLSREEEQSHALTPSA
jgi:hypothetical protein